MSPVEKETQNFLLFDDLVSLQHHMNIKCLPSVVFCISFQFSHFLPSLFYYFLSPWSKKKLLSFLFFIPLHDSTPFLFEVCGEKQTPCSKWCYILDLYIGAIMFSVTPFIFSVIPNSSFFFPCHWSDVSKECFSKATWRGCSSLWKCLGLCFCIIFSAVTGVCLKEQHGIYTVDLAISPTLSTAQIFCGLPSIKNRIKKEKYSTPEPLIFSDVLQ